MGIQSITESTKKLMAEFDTSIEVITNVNGKLFVIPDNLSKAALVKENLALSSELNSFKTEDCLAGQSYEP